MKSKVAEYLDEVEKEIEEEERVENMALIRAEEKIEYLTTLKNIEKFCLKKRFGSVAECGDLIARNVRGKLTYKVNEDVELKKKDVEEIRKSLKEYYRLVNKLLKPEYNLRYEEINQLKLGIIKVRDYCVSYGFYGRALEASKILGKTFRFDELETIKRVIKGYGQRQIINGVDQYEKVKSVRNNARRGLYGISAKALTNTDAEKLYRGVSFELKGKKFTLKDWENVTTKNM